MMMIRRQFVGRRGKVAPILILLVSLASNSACGAMLTSGDRVYDVSDFLPKKSGNPPREQRVLLRGKVSARSGELMIMDRRASIGDRAVLPLYLPSNFGQNPKLKAFDTRVLNGNRGFVSMKLEVIPENRSKSKPIPGSKEYWTVGFAVLGVQCVDC